MNALLNKTPFNPFFIGFDRLHEEISGPNYPPYNLSKVGEGSYLIEIAVAGFSKKDISVKLDKNKKILSILGDCKDSNYDYEFLHKGIASRNFSRKFTLAENIEVSKVNLENGILTVTLNTVEPVDKQEQEFDIQ
jgi:molecular chaperone IbpA